MKKLIAILTTVLMFSTTAYAGKWEEYTEKKTQGGYTEEFEENWKETQPYKDKLYIEENNCFEVKFETNEFTYKDRTGSFETFTCMNTKYVPLREMANFFGKKVEYDTDSGSVNIEDSEEEAVYQPKNGNISGKAVVVDTPISYSGNELGEINNGFAAETRWTGRNMLKKLNYDGSIYVPLKWLTEGFELLREYDGNKVRITEPSDRLKFIPNAKVDYVGYSEELDNSEGIIDEKLIEEALFRQWCHYAEPYDIEMKYKTVYYEGKPSVSVNVSMLNVDSYLQGGAYEVLQ